MRADPTARPATTQRRSPPTGTAASRRGVLTGPVAPATANRPTRRTRVRPDRAAGECSHLGVGEGERVAADVDDLPGGAPPSRRDRQRVSTGEHEVGVWWQPRRQLAHEPLAGRHRGGARAGRRGRGRRRRGRRRPTRRGPIDAAATSEGAPSADRIAADRRPASSSPGSQATHASMPHGAASLARIAWASAVVLPNPAPAITIVTGTSNLAASESSRCGRTSSPGNGEGGSGTRRPPWDGKTLITETHPTHQVAAPIRQGAARRPR